MADELPTPDTARQFTKTIADLYGEAVLTLLRIIADRANRGLDDTAQLAQLGDLLALRGQAQAVAAQLSGLLDETLAAVIAEAYDHGAAQGAANLAGVLGVRDRAEEIAAAQALRGTKTSTVEGLAKALSGMLTDLPIVRATEDAYRRAVAAAVVPNAAGVDVRRHAMQRTLDRLAMDGIGGFTDRSGRRWQLDSYAEMACRTTVAQAALQGTADRIRHTTPFGRVSDVADECPRCRPWEGKILLLGDPGDIPEKWRGQRYAGTLKAATSAGLFHPNCTHSLGAFIPGLTRDDTARPATSNPQGYVDRQRQRALERHVRDWKRREAVAIDPAAKALAAAKVQHWTAELAAHVAATNRPRRRDREALRL